MAGAVVWSSALLCIPADWTAGLMHRMAGVLAGDQAGFCPGSNVRVSDGRRRKFVGRDGSVLPGACDRYHHQYHLAGGSAGGQPLIGERGRIDPSAIAVSAGFHGSGNAGDPALTSDKEELVNLEGATAPEEEYAYTVQPRKFSVWNWPWVSNEDNGGQLLGHYAQHCIYMTYLPTTTTESGVLRPFRFNGLGVRVSNTR
ncbi:hypothetical protein quinque_013872 [Culex quinquefasciatus]